MHNYFLTNLIGNKEQIKNAYIWPSLKIRENELNEI